MKPKIWKNYYDIVLLPPHSISRSAIALSRTLYHKGLSRWTLGERRFVPHITLFQIPVQPGRLQDIIAATAKTTRELIVRHLHTTALIWRGKYCFWVVNRPPWLHELHRDIMMRAMPYFDRNNQVYKDQYKQLKDFPARDRIVMKKNLAQYGALNAGKSFLPHITIAVSKDGKAHRATTRPIQTAQLTFRPTYVAICQLGENGSCQKIIKKIPLHTQ